MSLKDWISVLEPEEQGYVRQVFRYINGTNGGTLPPPPYGMSQAKADVLRCHCIALNNGMKGRRKIGETTPFSVRISAEMKRQIAFESAQLDLPMSEYVIRCLNVGRPVVLAYPTLSKNFEEPHIQK